MLQGRSIYFAVHATIDVFTNFQTAIPNDVFSAIPFIGNIYEGARVVEAEQIRPGAFEMLDFADPPNVSGYVKFEPDAAREQSLC